MTTRFPAAVRIGLAVSGWVELAATLLPVGSAVRAVVTFGFVLFCPGIAVARLAQALLVRFGARPMDALEVFVVAVGVGLALGALVSEAFYLAQGFTAVRVVVVLAVITTVAALLPVRERRLSPRGPG